MASVAVQSLSHDWLFVTPINCSTPGFPSPSPWLAQTHVHWVGDAIQPSFLCHPLLLLPSISPSIRVFSNELALHIGSVRVSRIWLFATPWTVAHQASLSITNSLSLPKPMSIELVMPSNNLILCFPLLLLPPIPPSIGVFSSESTLRMRWPKYWSFSFSI